MDITTRLDGGAHEGHAGVNSMNSENVWGGGAELLDITTRLEVHVTCKCDLCEYSTKVPSLGRSSPPFSLVTPSALSTSVTKGRGD